MTAEAHQGYAIGVDFGTSGVRAIAVDQSGAIAAQSRAAYAAEGAESLAAQWQAALATVLLALPAPLRASVQDIAINGTSATVLLCDRGGIPLVEPLRYDDGRAIAQGEALRAIAPGGSPVLSPTSSLAKLLWWRDTLPPATWQRAAVLLHQADWLAYQLHGRLGISDYHNALKLGYDVGSLAYPDWLQPLEVASRLPQVLAPGAAIAPITAAAAERYSLPPTCIIHAGTTDSIAAFLASGATQPGEAVTSLGSTLVLKLLSTTRVDDSRYGIYSHRLGDRWLVGGASNTGGAVLQQFFSTDDLVRLSRAMQPDQPTGLDYYPLCRPGERFPIADPHLQPRLTPRPADPAQFLQGLLEGIARIEAQGYAHLQTLGATPLSRVWTAGGGAQNTAWTSIRQRLLGVPVQPAPETEAAVGTARLALRSRHRSP